MLMALVSAATLCSGQTGKPAVGPPPPPAPSVEHNANAWKEFVSQEGRFSVRMPAEPKLNRQEANTALGKLPVYFYSAETRVGGYMVGYSDFPKRDESPELLSAVLNGARDNVLAGDASRKLLSEKEVTIEGYPAREWLVADNHLLFRAETFLAKGRFYQVLFIAPLNVAFNNGRASANAADRTDFYEDISRRFFGSFKLLPSSPATEGTARPTPTPDTETKAAPAERAEGEVDRLLKRLPENSVLVIGACAEGDDCPPLPGNVGEVVVGKIISKPQPAYPRLAREARAQGPVMVLFVVDEEGKVIAAQAVGGIPLLQEAAVKAAREARFSPTLLGTKPVKVSGVITYNFVLQ